MFLLIKIAFGVEWEKIDFNDGTERKPLEWNEKDFEFGNFQHLLPILLPILLPGYMIWRESHMKYTQNKLWNRRALLHIQYYVPIFFSLLAVLVVPFVNFLLVLLLFYCKQG